MRVIPARSLQIIDSHTGGEPTRVVVGGLEMGAAVSMVERKAWMQREADWVRTVCIGEPRGFDAVVGALLMTGMPMENAMIFAVGALTNAGQLAQVAGPAAPS